MNKTTLFLVSLILLLFCSQCKKDEGASGNLENISTSGGANGIIAMPETAGVFHNYFSNYTKIVAPNGLPVHIIAQSGVSVDQILKARAVLQFYLTDVPGSTYGSSKAGVFNKMGENKACLAIFNDQNASENIIPEIDNQDYNFQDLYATECFVDASDDYIFNPNAQRDATFEEVLHLVHDQGIKPALPAYETAISAAAEIARLAGYWSSPQMQEWIQEGSVSQGYFATIVETYFGLWGHSTSAFFGEYDHANRAAMATGDHAGTAIIQQFFPEYMQGYTAHLSTDFAGLFTLSLDLNQDYTHKSQYILEATLSGNNQVAILGNQQNNILTGNASNNIFNGLGGNDRIDGGDGEDEVSYTGNYNEYNVTQLSNDQWEVSDQVSGRDGADVVTGVEYLRFMDQVIDL